MSALRLHCCFKDRKLALKFMYVSSKFSRRIRILGNTNLCIVCICDTLMKFGCWTGLRSMGTIKEVVIGEIRVVLEISRSSLLSIDYPI